MRLLAYNLGIWEEHGVFDWAFDTSLDVSYIWDTLAVASDPAPVVGGSLICCRAEDLLRLDWIWFS